MELNIAIHPLPKGRGLLAKEDKYINEIDGKKA
jgi:hypothetical protein